MDCHPYLHYIIVVINILYIAKKINATKVVKITIRIRNLKYVQNLVGLGFPSLYGILNFKDFGGCFRQVTGGKRHHKWPPLE